MVRIVALSPHHTVELPDFAQINQEYKQIPGQQCPELKPQEWITFSLVYFMDGSLYLQDYV